MYKKYKCCLLTYKIDLHIIKIILKTSTNIILGRIHMNQRPYVTFRNMVAFYEEELLALSQPPSWSTTPCQLFATAYSLHLQLPSTSA
jgi:hypothetical protein